MWDFLFGEIQHGSCSFTPGLWAGETQALGHSFTPWRDPQHGRQLYAMMASWRKTILFVLKSVSRSLVAESDTHCSGIRQSEFVAENDTHCFYLRQSEFVSQSDTHCNEMRQSEFDTFGVAI